VDKPARQEGFALRLAAREDEARGVLGELVEKAKGSVLNITGPWSKECAFPYLATSGRVTEFGVFFCLDVAGPVMLTA